MGQSKVKWVILLGITLLLISGSIFFLKSDRVEVLQPTGQIISDIYTDKSRYDLNDLVKIYVDLNNKNSEDVNIKLIYKFKQLNKEIYKNEKEVNLKAAETKQIVYEWNPPKIDYTGYLVEVYVYEKNKMLDYETTAVDVSSDYKKFPRYGYIANYPNQDYEQSKEIIERLNKYHINVIQFYDWQYKHHKPLAGTIISPADRWKDIANRDIFAKTIKDYIELAHLKNMKAANYNLMNGAYYGYETDGVKKEWGLYKDTNHEDQDYHPLPNTWATSTLSLMNPADKNWQLYIINAEKDAFDVYDFDIWHVDTLGNRGYLYDYWGNEIKLYETYSQFLNNSKEKLKKDIVCNAVNEYGQVDIARNADVDFLYAELWPQSGYSNYNLLKRAIDNAYKLTNGKKNIVIAAYMNYGIADKTGQFNENSVKLTDAVLFASGGSHIEIGDTGMLSKEYFPSANLKMSKSLENSMRNYYDFLVAYENVLRDDVIETSNRVEIPKFNYSDSADVNSIFTITKRKENIDIVHLINLLNVSNLNWRDDLGEFKEPNVIKDFKVRYYIDDANVESVSIASPDTNECRTVNLKYKIKQDEKGRFLEIKVPELHFWDMIIIEKGGKGNENN